MLFLAFEREFGPDPEFRQLYRQYLALTVILGFLLWIVPLVVSLFFIGEQLAAIITAISTLLPLLGIVVFSLYWISLYYTSIKFVLEDDEIVITKGVWWKTKSVVPYNRITNVNIYQGPLSRHLGLGKLNIQTAGFSGVSSSGVKTAEGEIFGVKNFEEVKDIVMNYVKGRRPVAVEAQAEEPSNMNESILDELRRIRKAVEK